MIRFACPECGVAYTVGDEKGGKTGKCPKCATAFTIPMPESGTTGQQLRTPKSVAPVSPPPTDPNAPVEIAPCPKCSMALTVGAEFLGADVECPGCKTVFTAKDKTAAKSSVGTKVRPVQNDDDDDDDDDDDRPVRKSKRRDDDDDDRPVRKSKRRDDDDDDDRPRKKSKKKKRRSNVESKRVTAALLAFFAGSFGVHKFYLGHTTAGIVYLLTCGLCGIGPVIDLFLYLMKSDDEFIEIYQEGGREWF
jgi:TM2 domain-containing membrane protein YozV